MRGEYDVVEELRVKKNNSIFSNKFIKLIVVILAFLILCGLCFNLVYLLSFDNIEKSDVNISANKKEDSSKIYIIEQKLRKDLEKMKSNIKSK